MLPRSVAVLPCQNLSPRAEDEYFAAGMHEEVLDHLARIRDVNVIASTSVQRYAGSGVPIPAIAVDLNVGAIVECSVRYAADRVRVSVRLIDGATAGELWSDSYDTPLGDVFAVQGEIATKIATALESTLSGQPAPVAPSTASMPAYAAYLKAISLYRTNGGIGVGVPASVRRTIVDLLSEALALDPDFGTALAWRGNVNTDSMLFDAWNEGERDARVAELMGSIEADARRALDLDPEHGMAHVVLGAARHVSLAASRCASRAGSRPCGCAERLGRRALQRDERLSARRSSAGRALRRGAPSSSTRRIRRPMGHSAWRCAR